MDRLHEQRPESLAEWLRGIVAGVGQRYAPVTPVEIDRNPPPGGTLDYEGRAVSFQFHENGRQYLVTIEDVTIEE